MKKMFYNSILAGICIGLAMVMYVNLCILITEYNYLILPKIAGAGFFAFALCYIKEQSLPLFTGRAGTPFPLKHLFGIVLPGNLIGTFIIGISCYFIDTDWIFCDLLDAPLNDNAITTAFKAILCGALMRIACDSKSIYVTVGCVFAFLISGFYHSIALSVSIFGTVLETVSGGSDPYPYITSNELLALTAAIIVIIIGNLLGAYLITFLKEGKINVKSDSI